jgi:hypothetical protein
LDARFFAGNNITVPRTGYFSAGRSGAMADIMKHGKAMEREVGWAAPPVGARASKRQNEE